MKKRKSTKNEECNELTLELISNRFKNLGVDISKIIELVEYINNTETLNLLKSESDKKIDKETLSKFIPFLDQDSKMNIFDLILIGNLDIELIKVLIPNTHNIIPLIENAIVCGVLDHKILKRLKN